MKMDKCVFKAIIFVILGCIMNVIFLEYIIKLDNGAGPLITFCQYLFIAIHGYIFTSKFGTVTPKIPPMEYIKLTTVFFINSLISNWTYAFNIPLPLNMIFRSGSLIANMILDIIIMQKKYSIEKYISVTLITIGIIICTIYTGNTKQLGCIDCNINLINKDVSTNYWFMTGILLSLGTLFLSATVGILQEQLYNKYGKETQEALYFTHLYPLPGFLLYMSSIAEHAIVATKSDILKLPLINFGIPQIWMLLIVNAITQYLCVNSVYKLAAECQSLTVTVVLTLRKFFSLLFSVIYFQNPFTFAHYIGTTLVFTGTIVFSEAHYKMKEIIFSESKKII